MSIVKKIILGTAAATVLAATPAAAAPFGHQNGRGQVERVKTKRVVKRNNGRQVVVTRQVQNRRWNRGERFDSRYAHNYRVVQNPRAYRLRDAPRGYRWVQSGNDAVLVAITSGVIGAVLANIF